MRIAFCVIKGIAFAGGIERYMCELIPHLVGRGHELTIYSMGHYGRVPSTLGGAHIVQVPCIRGGTTEKLTASASAAFWMAISPRHDIVHFHHVSAGWAAFLPRLRGQKCILQSHGIAWRCEKWTGFGRSVLKACERLAVSRCHAITVVSRSQVQYYRDKYGVTARYIPTGVSALKPVAPNKILELGLSPRSFILYVGRLSREKRPHDLIRALRKIQGNIKVVLAGGVGEGQYHRELTQLAAGDSRIMMLGEVRGRLLAELYSNARVYVQPSELEGMSLALLEAMSHGNCCLASNIPENVSVIGDAGLTFEVGNVDSLAQQLQTLIESPELARQKRVLARRYAQTHYSWELVAKRLDRLYSDVLNGDEHSKYIPAEPSQRMAVPNSV